MPRGTRAVFGHEREGSVGPQSMDTLISPAVKTLIGVCWCGMRFLKLAQRDVLDGITYSCKSSLCTDPYGNYVPGPKPVTIQGMRTATGEGTRGSTDGHPEFTRLAMRHALIVGDRYCKPIGVVKPTRRFVPQIKREARAPRDVVKRRREDVQHLWQQGKAATDIARTLDVAHRTVLNDLVTLRMHERSTDPLKGNWVVWLNGREHVLIQGRDFFCSATMLAECAHTLAHAWQVRCTTETPLARVVVINGRDQ